MKVLYTADQIAQRLATIGNDVGTDYKQGGLVLVGILKGASFLVADLARAIPIEVDFEFVEVVADKGERGEQISLSYTSNFDIKGKHVLICKDVFHTGITVNYLITHLSQQAPASMEVLALVDRPERRTVNLSARYAVFTDVPDGHLVGFGLAGPDGQESSSPDIGLLS